MAQRTREFGIRLAMGAQLESILGLILRETATLSVAGMAIGLIVAAFVMRVIASQIYSISPLDQYVGQMRPFVDGSATQ